MRRMLIVAGFAVAATAAAPSVEARTACDRYAHDRKVTGTVLGGVAGGLLGNVIAGRGDRTEGTLIGAGVGAVIGNQAARVKCDRGQRAYYAPAAQPSQRRSAPARRVRDVRPASYTAACRYETRSFYNQYGELVQAPTRVCG